MSETRKLLRVFLASPGDLQEERKIAKSVVDDINDSLAEVFGIQVELVGWEDTVTSYGRPQEIINRDLERCEVFVGMLWKRWGTPPQVGGRYTSGFEEEFETSIKRRQNGGSPEMSLFFKDVDQELLLDPGEDLKKVSAFKAKLIAEKKILFESFPDAREFERKFRRCIHQHLKSARSNEARETAAQSQAPTTEATPATTPTRESPFSTEGSAFLQEFLSKAEQGTESVALPAVEVARARLLISLVRDQGNDEFSLGVHDSNLIYAQGGQFTLGQRELSGLIGSALQRYSSENVPLWRWIAALDGFTYPLLGMESAFGSSASRREGALNAMRHVSDVLDPEDQETFQSTWFTASAPKEVRIAALRYLGDMGNASSLGVIRKEFDRNDSATVGAAVEATIRIRFRDSRESAIAALYELQTTSTNADLLNALFSNDAAISTEVLLGGISHQDSRVRSIVVKALRARNKLPDDVAEKLLSDGDAALRYEALLSLMENGRTYSEADAKSILVKQRGRGIIGGLLGGFGARPSADGDEEWDEFSRERLRFLGDKELEPIATELYHQEGFFELVSRHFSTRGGELREAIDDQFKQRFEKLVSILSERIGGNSKTLEGTRSLEKHLRKQYMRQGLDVLTRKAKAEDLARIRAALRNGHVEFSSSDAEYLRKRGEWEDIQLMVKAIAKSSTLLGLFVSDKDRSIYSKTAKTIYALGKERLQELLPTISSSTLLVRVIDEIPDPAFRRLTDASLTALLHSESADVRKHAALKSIRALSRKRLKGLHKSYVSGEQSRYYNVVHWLDLGISVPRERALSAAKKILDEVRRD